MPKQSTLHTQRSTSAIQTTLSFSGQQSAWKRYLLLFILLVATTLFYSYSNTANGQSIVAGNGTTPNGTIPPGGTIPPPSTNPTQGQVRVLHLAPIATDSNDTAIDICAAVGNPVAGLTGIIYRENRDYITVAPGMYDWFVGTPGCTTILLDLPTFVTAPGSIATILITGGANGHPLTSIFIVDELGQQMQLYLPLIHR